MEEEPSYYFVPYRFGCFSFQSYEDRRSLIIKGMLYPRDNGEWKLTPKATPYLSVPVAKHLRIFVEKFVSERGDALIARVYRESPYYATRSEILPKIISNKEERDMILNSSPKSRGRALFTIGYEGESIDSYLNRLIRNNVRLLCDVRRNPLSRKTGFSKNQLASYCSRVGIKYHHHPELGIPGHRRRQLNTKADYETLFTEYKQEDLPQAGEAIEKLSHLLKKYSRIALTCFEKNPEFCHRHYIAEAMQRQLYRCPAIQHI